jgi:putative colanic acid biosynthesis acetyltransferase WcaF
MDLSKFHLQENSRGRSILIVQLWRLFDSLFFNTSPQFMYGFRRFLLRLFGAKIGKDVLIRSTAKILYPWNISIGDYSWIGEDVILYSIGFISIGSNSVISQKSHICAGSHDYSDPYFTQTSIGIMIDSEVWIASDVFIADGVSIGKKSIIGARSSVFRDIPEFTISFGYPAKVHSVRNFNI